MVSIWLTRVKKSEKPAEMAKTGFPGGSRFSSNWNCRKIRLLAVLLNAGCPEAREAVLVDRELPGKEFVDGQRVAAAGFLEGKQTPADGRNDFGLAADDPPFCPGCRQIRNC
jgi:hypothetical protein